jgi:hypothetical protein
MYYDKLKDTMSRFVNRGELVRFFTKNYIFCVLFVLIFHVSLLVWSSTIHSPTNGEVPALASGIYHWHTGSFNLFRVNPPFVRMVAAIPVLFCNPKVDWKLNRDLLYNRAEFPVGAEFIKLNDKESFRYFTLARLFCIPFSLLGAIVCFRWATELYGLPSGYFAMLFWCFSPTILGHSSTIGPDTHAAACGLFAVYVFRHWLKTPTILQTIYAGFALGLAEITKTTWVILFLILPAVWIVQRIAKKKDSPKPTFCSLCMIIFIGVFMIHVAYGGERVFQPLGQFQFISQSFGGNNESGNNKMNGKNRFKNTILQNLPVPLPQNYLLGIDIQRSDFEHKYQNYLLGKWQYGGWWYYYLVAFAVKEPFPLLLLIFVSIMLLCTSFQKGELIILVLAIAIFTLISSQTGLNEHYRYLSPALPFLFVLASKAITIRLFVCRIGIVILSVWYCISSLAVFPHSISYFNELAGSSINGHRYLLGSNIEWGQDVLLLKKWINKHASDQPVFIDQCSYFGVESAHVNAKQIDKSCLIPGIYAVGVNKLYDPQNKYDFLLKLEPVARIGYSIHIYNLTIEDVKRLEQRSIETNKER